MTKKLGLSRGLGQFREEIKELEVLPELESLIPPLSEDEKKLLEESIVKDGIREALDVWPNDDKLYIVDGHNRYKIAKRKNISFKTKQHKFGSIEEVKEWMLRKQLGRRNLTDANRTYLIGLLYNSRKSSHGGRRDIQTKGQNLPLDENVQKIGSKTADIIAQETGTAPRTVRNAGEFAQGLEKVDPELKKDILAGKEKISKADIQKLSKKKLDKKISSAEEIRQQVNNEDFPKEDGVKKNKKGASLNRKKQEQKHLKQANDIAVLIRNFKNDISDGYSDNFKTECLDILKKELGE